MEAWKIMVGCKQEEKSCAPTSSNPEYHKYMTPGKLPVVLPQSMKLCTPKRKNNSRTQSLMIYVMELNMSCYCRDESTVQSTVDDHPQIVSKIIHVEIEIIIVII